MPWTLYIKLNPEQRAALRASFKQRGITQRQAASRLGYHEAQMSMVLSGKNRIDPFKARVLFDLLGSPPELSYLVDIPERELVQELVGQAMAKIVQTGETQTAYEDNLALRLERKPAGGFGQLLQVSIYSAGLVRQIHQASKPEARVARTEPECVDALVTRMAQISNWKASIDRRVPLNSASEVLTLQYQRAQITIGYRILPFQMSRTLNEFLDPLFYS